MSAPVEYVLATPEHLGPITRNVFQPLPLNFDAIHK